MNRKKGKTKVYSNLEQRNETMKKRNSIALRGLLCIVMMAAAAGLIVAANQSVLADHKPNHNPGGGDDGPGGGELTYTVIDLGTLGDGTFSSASDINDAGQVVGSSLTGSGDEHAFLWEDVNHDGQSDLDEMIDLGTLGGDTSGSSATGINNLGQVVGSSLTGSGDEHAFLWDAGVMIDLGTLGGTSSSASDINDLGQVVGISDTGVTSLESYNIQHAFLWLPSPSDAYGLSAGMHDLGTLGGDTSGSSATGINNLGQVVGRSRTASGFSHAFLWLPSDDGLSAGMHDLETLATVDSSSEAVAINDAGQVFGLSHTDRHLLSILHTNLALWEFNSGVITITDLGTWKSTMFAYDIGMLNGSVQVVGESCRTKFRGTYKGGVTQTECEPYLWENGEKWLNLNDSLDSAAFMSAALGINNVGEIVGRRDINGVWQAYLMTPNL